MKKITGYIITAAVFVALGYVAGMSNLLKIGLLNGQKIIQSDTTTVTHIDTTTFKAPVAKATYPVGLEIYPIAQVPVLLYLSDTITKPYFVNNDLIIPRTQKYYKDPRYEAWVSGYNPKLDSLLIYQQTKTVTIEKTRQYKAELSLNGDMRMYSYTAISTGFEAELKVKGYGFVLGTGALATPSGWKWYGMAGIRYNLFTKKW